jgi:hypothetical protein
MLGSINAAFRAALAEGIIDDPLNFIRIGVGIVRSDVLNRALKRASPDSLLDEFREIALFHALGTQERAQGQIGVLRDLDPPADSLFFHGYAPNTLKLIDAQTSIRLLQARFPILLCALHRDRCVHVKSLSSPDSLGTLAYHPRHGYLVAGASWEGFAIEDLIVRRPCPHDTELLSHCCGSRDRYLLLAIPGHGLWALEIKRSPSAKPERGFHFTCDDLNPRRRFLINSGDERYPIGPGLEAVGLTAMAGILAAL